MDQQFRLSCNACGWMVKAQDFALNGFDAAGKVSGVCINDTDVWFSAVSFRQDGAELCVGYTGEGWSMEDTVNELEDGYYVIHRIWRNMTGLQQTVRLTLAVEALYEASFYMIPCVSYNGNQWGTGREPKGLCRDGQPWEFAYNRQGLPSATFSENKETSVGLFASDTRPEWLRSSCSLVRRPGAMRHQIFWPEAERPLTYIGRDQYAAPAIHAMSLEPGACFEVEAYLSLAPVSMAYYGWTKTYDRALSKLAAAQKPPLMAETIWRDGIHFAKSCLFTAIAEGNVFSYGLLPEGVHHLKADASKTWKNRMQGMYEIGWCGQNAMLAHALLYDGIYNGNADSLAKGEAVLDTWARLAKTDSGLFYTLLGDKLLGGKAQADVCNLGFGAWQMLCAYELMSKAGREKPEWRAFGLDLCAFFENAYNDKRMFGKLWSLTGECLDEEGTIGGYIMLPLICAYDLTGDKRYLESASRAFRAYATRDLDVMSCTAGALDTHCIDQETCWPLLKTALDLYERTNDSYFLTEAIKAGYYLLSWMFHYNVLSDQTSDFNQFHYDTTGALAVSAQHHHVSSWGALIAIDWMRLSRLSGDGKWKIRAEATWYNSLLCVSDGALKVHGLVRPAGAQNEGFCQCNWGTDGEGPGTFNDWLVAWTDAYRLLALMSGEFTNGALKGKEEA
jgi:hypothetical protein